MKKIGIIGAILILLLAFVLRYIKSPSVATPTTQAPTTQTLQKPELSFANVQADMALGAQLLDVRTPEEFKESYISGASNLPLATIQQGGDLLLPTTTKIYLYCRSGNRSAEAKTLLEKSGYLDVTDLGGMPQVVAIGGVQIK